MKTKLSILLVLFSFLNMECFAQEKTKKEIKTEKELQKQKEIKALIDSKNFMFEAQKLTPQGGRFIILDYNTYFLKLKKTNKDYKKVDCCISFLQLLFFLI